ncbi:MAG TPA: NAD-dependent epimerase/dehydratase family protein [Patescibacteria group bacterium]|nr:NAD-dependent epimerase/dehydratase family protein [Patescibacteria group bacterium]
MTKILITGGAGFIGSTLADKLIEAGHEVIIVDNLFSGKKYYIPSQAKFYRLDIVKDDLSAVFEKEKPQYVFHLAAQIDVRKAVQDPNFDVNVNILGGLNVLRNVYKYKVKKIIFSSTGGAVYGEANTIPTPEDYPAIPLSPYGIDKLCFENYLKYYHQIFKQEYTTLRFANVYGPRQYKGGEAGVVAIFCSQIAQNLSLTLNGDGSQTRDFVYVDDVVRALINAMTVNYNGEINIGSNIESKVKDIIKYIEDYTEKNCLVEKRPAVKGEQQRSFLDSSLAKKVLDWKAEVSLEEGIKATYKWTLDNN